MLFNLISKLLLGVAALKNSTPLEATIANCGEGTSLFTLNSAAIDPINPNPGDKVALTLEYTVPTGVTIVDGTAQYDITWNYIPFAPSTEPLCQDIPCPLGSGNYVNTSYSDWPTGVSGLLVSQMKWLDVNAELLLCVEISATV